MNGTNLYNESLLALIVGDNSHGGNDWVQYSDTLNQRDYGNMEAFKCIVKTKTVIQQKLCTKFAKSLWLGSYLDFNVCRGICKNPGNLTFNFDI